MKTVNMHQAKTHLSRLVEEAAEGAEIIIAKAGKPRARLVACAQAAKIRMAQRQDLDQRRFRCTFIG
jgi:prevent-host-death family protein